MIDPRIDVLIDAYIDHTIDDDQFEALCDWLREDAANRQTFARKLALHSEIAEWCVERSGSPLAGDLQATEADAAATPHIWIDELAQLEGPARQADQADKPLTVQECFAVTGYALRLALTSKPAKRVYAYAGIAAAVLLAFVLLGPWGGNETPTDVPLASDYPNDSIEPGPVGPPLNNPVATLTATHNAQWSSQPGGDVRPGTQLTVGQRLTLTQGFAEITTARGAVAIIEAPATIELINNNALHLHEGKLVGICETDTSKGFVVRTDHATIVDLGTEFGVEVAYNQVTTTVFTGEVTLTTPDSEPQPLTENQTARLTDAGDEPSLVVEQRVARGFARRLPVSTNAGDFAIAPNIASLGTVDTDGSGIWGEPGTNLNDGVWRWSGFDGWHSDNATHPTRIWMTWDRDYAIDKIGLVHSEAGAEYVNADYLLQALNPGGDPAYDSDWTTLVTITGNTDAYPEHTFDPVATRGIRLYITNPGTAPDQLARFEEFLVQGTAVQTSP